MAGLSGDLVKYFETQLPLLHLEREYTLIVRPRTDPVSGRMLPGMRVQDVAYTNKRSAKTQSSLTYHGF